MKYRGPLGLPRITSAGPLTRLSFSQSNTLSEAAASNIVESVAEERDISADDLTEDEYNDLAAGIALQIYPPGDKVQKAKNIRFQECLKRKWANNWADGIEQNNEDINFDNELEKVSFMVQGCKPITEANTAENEEMLPEVLKGGRFGP